MQTHDKPCRLFYHGAYRPPFHWNWNGVKTLRRQQRRRRHWSIFVPVDDRRRIRWRSTQCEPDLGLRKEVSTWRPLIALLWATAIVSVAIIWRPRRRSSSPPRDVVGSTAAHLSRLFEVSRCQSAVTSLLGLLPGGAGRGGGGGRGGGLGEGGEGG